MQLIVASIFEKDFTIGKVFQAASWQEAYDLAEELILDLYLSQKGIDVSENTDFLSEIQQDIQNENYHLLWSVHEKDCTARDRVSCGNNVAVQICAIE